MLLLKDPDFWRTLIVILSAFAVAIFLVWKFSLKLRVALLKSIKWVVIVILILSFGLSFAIGTGQGPSGGSGKGSGRDNDSGGSDQGASLSGSSADGSLVITLRKRESGVVLILEGEVIPLQDGLWRKSLIDSLAQRKGERIKVRSAMKDITPLVRLMVVEQIEEIGLQPFEERER
jgi:hypothetical protein